MLLQHTYDMLCSSTISNDNAEQSHNSLTTGEFE